MDITINYTAVLAATVAMFASAAIWYTPLFGNIWGKIHGFDKLSKKEQDAARKQMAPLMVTQLLLTTLSVFVLSHFLTALPNIEWYEVVIWLWAGFIVPAQVGAVIFGGTEQKWMIKKSLIMVGGSLFPLLIAALVLNSMM